MRPLNHEKTVVDESTGELKELNDNFVQFYVDNMDLIIKINKQNPTAGTILLWIVKHMDKNNALVASQQAICDALDIHRNTVTNAINFLKKEKALDVFKSGTTNVYAINSEIAWKQSATNKKFAHFTAKVYLTGQEQNPEFKTQLFGHAIEKAPSKNKMQKNLDKEAVKALSGSFSMFALSVFSMLEAYKLMESIG